jgi:hypothetical protein
LDKKGLIRSIVFKFSDSTETKRGRRLSDFPLHMSLDLKDYLLGGGFVPFRVQVTELESIQNWPGYSPFA